MSTQKKQHTFGAMNPAGFPDWNISADLPLLAHKNNPFRLDGNELVELLWENGQVVLHSQTQTHEHPKPGQVNNPVDNQSFHRNSVFSSENPIQSNNLIQEDAETVSWIYCPVDHPFDKESHFLPEFLNSNQEECPEIEPQKPADHGFRSNFASHHPSLPPRFHHVFDYSSHSNKATTTENAGNGGGDGLVNKESSGFRSSNKGCSSVTVASSHCGSNQVMVDAADTSRVSSSGIGGDEDRGFSAVQAKDQVGKMSSHGDRAQTEALETANTSSSSGGSDTSFGKTCNQSGGTSSLKRKSRCGEDDSACQSKDDAELESAPIKKPWSSRKSRAAEVHNLSERRRRDRINEKMRALQELLPQSNKTDKASMLDEAIEYMKSLQLQLQMMWMGSGMAPFMFPGVQHYMSRIGMGLGQMHPMPHNPMHFPRLPLVDQARIPPPPDQAAATALLFNPFNYQLQNPNVINPEQFANFMQYHHPLQSASQINVFSTFGPKTPTNTHMIAPPGNNGPSAG